MPSTVLVSLITLNHKIYQTAQVKCQLQHNSSSLASYSFHKLNDKSVGLDGACSAKCPTNTPNPCHDMGQVRRRPCCRNPSFVVMPRTPYKARFGKKIPFAIFFPPWTQLNPCTFHIVGVAEIIAILIPNPGWVLCIIRSTNESFPAKIHCSLPRSTRIVRSRPWWAGLQPFHCSLGSAHIAVLRTTNHSAQSPFSFSDNQSLALSSSCSGAAEGFFFKKNLYEFYIFNSKCYLKS